MSVVNPGTCDVKCTLTGYAEANISRKGISSITPVQVSINKDVNFSDLVVNAFGTASSGGTLDVDYTITADGDNFIITLIKWLVSRYDGSQYLSTDPQESGKIPWDQDI